MKSYRDLEIYKESRRLAIEVHALSLTLPKHELYEEGSQVRRSSKAVTALIVEGYGRKRYKAEYIKYLIYAQSECDETIVHLDFLIDTGSLTDKLKGELLRNDYDSLSKKINNFTQWVEDNFIEKRSGSTTKSQSTKKQTETEELKNYKI
jgi:four helix bundle protein